ncbi:neutral zinc metallopeptidase [Nitrosomonas sp. PY1]|uniref:KPN_02809 family neutral zinc metallopeptidase n=1 Tax=Nitrosomonas sp. PY1 TaxID=1803906 RepID=UPI001FC7D2C7|nr:neutral zinc metallopeptidase [Nitrosomonas sp. PY1]GKS70144.1 neutral zinc metallopeptidase [Nitrosomonas sp. PY1]
MLWRGRRQSNNVEDRRGQFARGGTAIGGGGIIIALIAVFVFGQDPLVVLQSLQQQDGSISRSESYQPSDQEQEIFKFVSVVLADTEDTWGQIFQKAGQIYKPPSLVVFTDMTPTACGTGQAASGPFYCPGDQKIYLDLSFLEQLQRMGASGDLAVAYVIAHEVGHHVQTLTGVSHKVRDLQSQSSRIGANAIQVKMELQADCLAGVWIQYTQKRTQFLEKGDLAEAMQAAEAVGDDNIMRQAGIPPRREAFTHGSAKDRMNWLNRGLQAKDLDDCETGI